MSYRELFSSVDCKCIVIIEDDFRQIEYKKEHALYDITRMALEDREQYLTEIKRISPALEAVLLEYLFQFDCCFDQIGRWEECIPRGDISCAFPLIDIFDASLKASIEEQYNLFEGDEVQAVYEAGAKYGIGIEHSSHFDTLYDEYILYNNRAQSIRIYTDFSAETQRQFITDIDRASYKSSIVCILDNYLSGSNRAQEVINVISEKSQTDRKNIIGSIFSSKDIFEEISNKLYFEYTSKGNPEQLQACIAKSAYNYFIAELKNETLLGLSNAFDTAMKNKGIAFFLAKKAQVEGTSEYEIINDWIKLLTTTTRKDADTIKRMIRLSRVINSLDDSNELPDATLQQLNTLEAFDYTINDYFLPVAAGDVFTNSSGEWFVLIGQDCDMARSTKRIPNNALAELLPARIRPQTDFNKWSNDLERTSIFSFRKALCEESTVLQVEYKSRKYISNEILNLCSFSSDGQCRITLSEELAPEKTALMPEYIVGYYAKLQSYFSAVKTLRTQAGDAFEAVIAEEYSPRLISLMDFDIASEIVTFDLKRVCRLTHDYVFYLYKLYLEYKGRRPFQTINLIRQEDTSLPVMFNKKKTGLSLYFRCVPIPDKSNRKDWCWIVDAAELNRILEAIKQPIISDIDREILLTQEINPIDLTRNKKLCITKTRQNVNFAVI